MMKRNIDYILLSLLMLPLFFGCKPEERQAPDPCPGAVVQLHIGVPQRPEVQLRAPEPSRESEEAIDDLYLLVFDKNGDRVSTISRFYSKQDLALATPYTSGTLSDITLPEGSNTLYLIANVEASYNMTIGKADLDRITSEQDLKNLQVSFKNIHQAPSNRGIRNNILMWGRTNVTVTCGMTKDVNIQLRSVESKVRFRIFIHPKVKDHLEVTLESYSVQNIPLRGLVVADRFLTFSYNKRETDVYNIESRVFDVPEAWDDNNSPSPADANGAKEKFVGDFYYYQMENSQEPKKDITEPAPEGLKLRSKLLKHPDGKNIRELNSDHPSFEYAPEMCTFVRIKAKVASTQPGKEYVADTYYYIPLGHDPNDPNNYSVLGNYTYTYNLYIKGVKDLMIEADVKSLNKDLYDNDGTLSGKEVNPMTEGFVFFDAVETLVDAHYANFEMKVSKLALEEIKKPGTAPLEYLARTPFDNAHLSTKGKTDIKWVTFSPMKKDDKKLIPYPGDAADISSPVPLIRVNELEQWIKNTTDLSPYLNSDGTLSFTVFVDEFFYDEHPITKGAVSYTDFINQPARGLAIYVKLASSKDQKSMLLRQNLLHLRQRAIWSVFGTSHVNTPNAYGMESIDETKPMSNPRRDFANVTYDDVKHIDGRINTLNIWKKSNSTRGDYRITPGASLWRYKMVPTRSNTKNVMHLEPNDPKYSDNPYIKGNWFGDFEKGYYDNGAFACLQRNRDNNGDGIIDEDEIQWYLPSFSQVINTYIGKAAIPEKFWFHSLRYRLVPENIDRYKDMMYAISTPTGINGKIGSYWADEGISFGNDVAYNVRCFRNLPATITPGTANAAPTGNNFGYISTLHKATPTSPAYVKVSSRMDPTSYRARFVGSGPLPTPHYYRDAANSLTYEFYVASTNVDTSDKTVMQVYNEYYVQGKDPCDTYTEHGITGWRTPNQVELAVIFMLDMGLSGNAADDTPTNDAFGNINNTYANTFAVPNLVPKRINMIIDGDRINERNWNQSISEALRPSFIRCVKDKK